MNENTVLISRKDYESLELKPIDGEICISLSEFNDLMNFKDIIESKKDYYTIYDRSSCEGYLIFTAYANKEEAQKDFIRYVDNLKCKLAKSERKVDELAGELYEKKQINIKYQQIIDQYKNMSIKEFKKMIK